MANAKGTEARAWVSEGALLLDVRTKEEFQQGHLPGAVNIPVQELPQRLTEVPEGKRLVVYCAAGGRSAQAKQLLDRVGRGPVYDLGSGQNW